MELAQISLIQVLTLFFMIFLGFLLTKIGLIKIETKTTLTNILVYIVVPFMVINSYITTSFDETIVTNLLWCFLFSFLSMLLCTIPAMIIRRFWKTDQRNILSFAMIFSNSAYMGFPLIEALFGSESLIYASGFLTVFNIYLWTFGYGLVSRSFNPKKVVVSILKTPVIYALIVGLILFFLKIELPSYVQKPISLIGNMNTPLSMFLIGMVMSQLHLSKVFKNGYMWTTIAIKLLLAPVLTLALLYLFKYTMNADTLMLQVIFVLMACPCVSITSVFAIQFQYDEDVAVSSVVISTLLSLVTLPLFTLLISVIL
jgi:malate permease and related proteins